MSGVSSLLVFEGRNRPDTIIVQIYIKCIDNKPVCYVGGGLNVDTLKQVAYKEEVILENLLKWATLSGIRFTFDNVNDIKKVYQKLNENKDEQN